MSVSDSVRELPPELVETAAMIRAAYPHGIPEDAYLPLLALLVEGMSFRALAKVLSYCTGKTYIQVYHDTLGVASPYGPKVTASPAYETVARHLRQHGYDEWLAKGE
jgi:hypothetical protein